jgi:hypothetical protein
MNLKHFVLEGDSLTVISALNSPAHSLDWHLKQLIVDTLALLPPSSMWEAKKINRSANFCTHHVAFWATARVLQGSGCIPIFPLFLLLHLTIVVLHHLLFFSLLEGL